MKGAAKTEELCPTLKRHNSFRCQNCLPKSPLINRSVILLQVEGGIVELFTVTEPKLCPENMLKGYFVVLQL